MGAQMILTQPGTHYLAQYCTYEDGGATCNKIVVRSAEQAAARMADGRDLGEALGFQVDWDGTVIVKTQAA